VYKNSIVFAYLALIFYHTGLSARLL